jgi:hypothetical protein
MSKPVDAAKPAAKKAPARKATSGDKASKPAVRTPRSAPKRGGGSGQSR